MRTYNVNVIKCLRDIGQYPMFYVIVIEECCLEGFSYLYNDGDYMLSIGSSNLLSFVKFMVHRGADINKIVPSCKYDPVDVIKYCMDMGASVDVEDMFCQACEYGAINCAKFLMNHPEASIDAGLCCAIQKQNIDIVKLLIGHASPYFEDYIDVFEVPADILEVIGPYLYHNTADEYFLDGIMYRNRTIFDYFRPKVSPHTIKQAKRRANMMGLSSWFF